MRRLLNTRWHSIAAMLLLMLVLVAHGDKSAAASAAGTREKLIGAWKLVSLDEPGPDGQMRKLARTGVIIYTADGHMGVQFLVPKGAPAATSGPIQYEQGGYEAYFGTYTLDEKASTVTHHVEGALVRSLIGKDLTRVYRFSGKQLILKSSRADEHWTVVWEHY